MMENYTESPPPYQLQENDIYLPDMDLNAWPSSYYGRSRRVDLAKFYHNILKASSEDQCSSDSSSSSSDEEIMSYPIGVTENPTNANTKKVTFSTEPDTIYEYESEYDTITKHTTTASFFDDGWPGRTKIAMQSSGFMDFKSKIEAKLGAINDPSLISELDKSVEECTHQDSPLYGGYYRHRKSPLVQKLKLRPIPNNEMEQPSLILDDTPSPSNSYTDSPLTPKDGRSIPILDEAAEPLISAASTTSSASSGSVGGGSKWLSRTLSRIRSTSSSSSKRRSHQ